MKNELIQTHLTSGQLSTQRLAQIGYLVNKSRLVQGWTILGPTETAPIAEVWAEQLDRVKAPCSREFYDELISRAVDLRVHHLKQGKQMPAFGIELLLAAFEGYQEANRESDFERYKRMYGSSEFHNAKHSITPAIR